MITIALGFWLINAISAGNPRQAAIAGALLFFHLSWWWHRDDRYIHII